MFIIHLRYLVVQYPHIKCHTSEYTCTCTCTRILIIENLLCVYVRLNECMYEYYICMYKLMKILILMNSTFRFIIFVVAFSCIYADEVIRDLIK